MADLNASITALNQQMTALLAALQPILTGTAPAPAAPAATFATTPGTHQATAIIDYSTRTGTALYEQASESLYEDEEKFDLQNEKAPAFVREVKARAEKMGWTNDTQGITTYQVDGENVDLIENYGLIPMNEIQDQSKPWYEVTGAKVNQRAAQNNAQMFEMLMSSLTQSAKNQVQVYKDEYLLSNAGTPDKKVGNAAALYKVIMRLTTLDTKSTNKSLRDRLKDLPTVAATLNGDVDALHTYFNDVYNQLKARGEDVDDKEDILFAAYANIPDGKFQAYMEKKESDWYEDVNDMRGQDWTGIMKKAKQKYDLLKGDTHYKWGTPSIAEQKVIALQAQVEDLKSENLQISKKLKSKIKDPKEKKDEKKDGNKQKKKNEKDTGNKKRQKKDEAWKKVPPKAGEPKSKEQGGKKWNWCEHHQAWCIHHPTECELAKKLQASTTTPVANQAETRSSSSSNTSTAYTNLLAHLASIEE
jgi:hypothetical protein